MIVDATAKSPHFWAWAAIVLASVGAFINAGIKIPHRAFFGADSGKRPAEAPTGMLAAMAVAALVCVAMGVLPGQFYSLLPNTAEYHAFTVSHMISQGQLLIPALLVWVFLNRRGLGGHQARHLAGVRLVHSRLLQEPSSSSPGSCKCA